MKIKKLTGFWEKTLGLSFKKEISPIYFETRWGIHTFFVREPIMVVICDDNYNVKKVIKNLKPRRIFVWNPKYKKVFEFPANNNLYSKIKLGDKIDY